MTEFKNAAKWIKTFNTKDCDRMDILVLEKIPLKCINGEMFENCTWFFNEESGIFMMTGTPRVYAYIRSYSYDSYGNQTDRLFTPELAEKYENPQFEEVTIGFFNKRTIKRWKEGTYLLKEPGEKVTMLFSGPLQVTVV